MTVASGVRLAYGRQALTEAEGGQLRRALHAHADHVQPARDGLDRIRARAVSRSWPARWRRVLRAFLSAQAIVRFVQGGHCRD